VETTVEPGIDVTLRVPDTVVTGEPFDIRTRLDNHSGRAVTATTGSVALWEIGVYDDGEAVPVEGAMQFSATVVTDHRIDPGASTSSTDLWAVRSSSEGQPIAPGAYTARLTLNWQINDINVKDTLETQIVFEKE
jgi:hypothetical protein